MSQRRVLEEERHASYSFLDQMLRQNKDVAFVIHFDHEVELLQDLTSSRQKLESALQTLQTPQFGSANGGGSQGGNAVARMAAYIQLAVEAGVMVMALEAEALFFMTPLTLPPMS